ncbi:MAG: MBL fold metallo-hydrolase [bacterium]
MKRTEKHKKSHKLPQLNNGQGLAHGLETWLNNVKHVLKKMLKFSLMHKNRPKIAINRAEILKNWVIPVQIEQSSTKPVITWLGHATFLVQINGFNILTDPSFFEISMLLPRLTPFPMNPKDLPKIDVVLVSHNHPDHLNSQSVRMLKKHGHNPIILTPQGTGRWFKWRNINNVHEKSWWQAHTINPTTSHSQTPINFTFLPAHHWSGRKIIDTNLTLWGSWMIEHENFKIYFTGDSAYGQHFSQIGQKYGNIDVALMPIAPNTPEHLVIDSHVNTHESIQAFGELNAQNFIPMHWGTFPFEHHSFDEPVSRLYAVWNEQQEKLINKKLHVLKIGQSQTF